jgi:hypothetical protein
VGELGRQCVPGHVVELDRSVNRQAPGALVPAHVLTLAVVGDQHRHVGRTVGELRVDVSDPGSPTMLRQEHRLCEVEQVPEPLPCPWSAGAKGERHRRQIATRRAGEGGEVRDDHASCGRREHAVRRGGSAPVGLREQVLRRCPVDGQRLHIHPGGDQVLDLAQHERMRDRRVVAHEIRDARHRRTILSPLPGNGRRTRRRRRATANG